MLFYGLRCNCLILNHIYLFISLNHVYLFNFIMLLIFHIHLFRLSSSSQKFHFGLYFAIQVSCIVKIRWNDGRPKWNKLSYLLFFLTSGEFNPYPYKIFSAILIHFSAQIKCPSTTTKRLNLLLINYTLPRPCTSFRLAKGRPSKWVIWFGFGLS